MNSIKKGKKKKEREAMKKEEIRMLSRSEACSS
jgi:hypothetical protein